MGTNEPNLFSRAVVELQRLGFVGGDTPEAGENLGSSTLYFHKDGSYVPVLIQTRSSQDLFGSGDGSRYWFGIMSRDLRAVQRVVLFIENLKKMYLVPGDHLRSIREETDFQNQKQWSTDVYTDTRMS